jgi:NADH:ubiquinone oxidoreductase subunit 4 (subunit M)
LPEAHVEAPTVGSIILASILLKLGSYGLLRFLISLFPHSTLYFRPLVLILCFLGSIYGAVMALVQVDIKKIIAYSSISHMNFAILGLFSLNLEGILGSMLIFISHGLTSAGLFFLVGVLYKRFNTRLLRYYGGVFNFMPFFSFFFFFFTFSNIAFPGTLNYCSELLVFLGFLLSKFSFLFLLALILPFLISVVYSVLTYNKICFGVKSDYLSSVYDLTKLEFFILSILTFYTVFFGIFSYYLIDFIYLDISKISNVYKFI